LRLFNNNNRDYGLLHLHYYQVHSVVL